MALRIVTSNLTDFAQESTLRIDYDYLSYQSKLKKEEYYKFDYLFDVYKDNNVNIEEELTDDFLYAEIGNVNSTEDIFPNRLNFNKKTIQDENYYKKISNGDIIKIKKDDILISKVRPYLNKVLFGTAETEKIYFTSAFIHLRPRILNKILFYSLKSIFLKELISISRQGKGYPTVNQNDFKYLKFSKKVIDTLLAKEKKIIAQIESIEKNIIALKRKIIPESKIINKIFAREFSFDENLYNDFGKGMTAGTQSAQNRELRIFNTKFSNISKNKVLRCSTRFHNPPTLRLNNKLHSIPLIKVKQIIDSYEKGIQPVYDLTGEIPVVKISSLKNSYIDFEESETVSLTFFKGLPEEKKLKMNDVILCSTGKISLGKIDVFREDFSAITSVDNYIFRLNKNYDIDFFVYFFRSVLGYFQIERDYTGTTNQIHLYWEEISNFEIPNISLKEQNRIVKEINKELENNEKVRKLILSERKKIDEIILNEIN